MGWGIRKQGQWLRQPMTDEIREFVCILDAESYAKLSFPWLNRTQIVVNRINQEEK